MDYGALVKDTFSKLFEVDNLVPLLLGSLILTFGSLLSLGILAPPLTLAYTKMCIQVSRGDAVSTGDMIAGLSRFVSSWVLALIMGIGITIGFVLLFIPGLVLMVLTSFAFHALSDDESASAMDALKVSVEFVKTNLVEVIMVMLIGGLLSFVIGLTGIGSPIASIPIMLMSSLFYVRQGHSSTASAL